jgi:hypothetical protein
MANQEIAKFAVKHVLPMTFALDIYRPDYSAFSAKVTHVSLPSNVLPSLTVSKVSNHAVCDTEADYLLETEWQDCPVALHFEGLQHPVIFFNVPLHLRDRFPAWHEVTVLRRDSVAGLFALIEECVDACHVPSIRNFGGESCTVAPACWDDVVMGDTVTKLLRRDFESFFQRKRWFQENKLPFRRGYLLHGPAGNGKTSVIRYALASWNIRPRHQFDDDGNGR